jgi:hypothetical protein
MDTDPAAAGRIQKREFLQEEAEIAEEGGDLPIPFLPLGRA